MRKHSAQGQRNERRRRCLRGERPGRLNNDDGGSDEINERFGDGILLLRRSGGVSKDRLALDKKALKQYFGERAADVRSQPGGRSAGRVRRAIRYRRCLRRERLGRLKNDDGGSDVIDECFGGGILLLWRSGGISKDRLALDKKALK